MTPSWVWSQRNLAQSLQHKTPDKLEKHPVDQMVGLQSLKYTIDTVYLLYVCRPVLHQCRSAFTERLHA